MTVRLFWLLGPVLALAACSSPKGAAKGPEVSEIPERPADTTWEPASVSTASRLTEESLSVSPVVPGVEQPPAFAGSGRTHTLRKGETLMSLARLYYQDASQWRAILAANAGTIQDPNKVFVGQVLVIP